MSQFRARTASTVPVCVAFLVGAVSPAVAQDALEEVVVTAQKRMQNAQDVGISISVLAPDQLQNLNITTATGIADRIPSMRVDSPGPVNATYNLRGVATRDVSPHNEGAVAYFNDGVYVSIGQATTAPLFDLERVEVLKGPQGTLFGRNATGGLVQAVSRKPSQTFDAYAQVNAGSFDQYGFEGSLGGPLTSTVSGRVSLFTNRRDGFITNQTGPDQEALENYSGRAQLLFEPSDTFNALLNVRYSTYQPQAARGYDSRPLIVDATGTTRAPASQSEYAAYCSSLFAAVGGVPPGITVAPPGAVQRGNCFFAQPSTDTWTTASNDSHYSNHYAAASATLNWNLNDALTLASVSDFQNFTSDFMSDVDGSPLQLFNFGTSVDAQQVSQEFRLTGDAGAVHWIAGVYYLDIDGDFAGTFDVMNNPAFLSIEQQSAYQLDTRSYAGFAHVEYDFSPQWAVIAGARWTEDKKELDQPPGQCADPAGGLLCGLYGNVLFPTALAFAGYRGEIEKGDWAGKLELNWKPADDQLLYAGVNRGTKVGSFNAGAGQFLTLDQIPYRNETLTSYEAGIKSTLPDGKTILNSSVFFYNYDDYQTYAVLNGTLRVFNTDAEVKGAEIELITRPLKGLTLQLSGSYVDAVQTDLPTPTGPRDVVMPGAPKWSAFGMTRYSWPLASGSLDASIDGSYVGKRSSDALDPAALRLPSYVRANASIGYEATSGWSARAWVKNLANRSVMNFTTNLAAIDGGYEIIWEEPRTYGVSLAWRWQ